MNARQAQLFEQRQRAKRLYSMGLGQRRLSTSLSPANTAVSSIAQKYDRDADEAMLKEWQAGQITDDEYLAHQEKALNRPYLNPENKAAASADLKILRGQIEDKKTYEAYKSGRLSKRQLLSYETNKLLGLTPGSQTYDLQVSTVNDLTTQVKVDERKQLRLAQEAKIEGLPGRNTPEEYGKKAELYQMLADQARVDNQVEEADQYLQKSYEYRDYSVQLKQDEEQKQITQQEKQATALKETDRNNLVSTINTWVNDYRNNRVSIQEFTQGLGELEKKAVELKETDLLNSLTDWRNYAREDLAKGKTWARGGTGTGQGVTSTKQLLNQGKLEDVEYEKAKQALAENITDKDKLIAATAELTDRYLNGSEATADDPDGWVGLAGRAAIIQNQIQTTGKGSIAELASLQKKINAKEKDFGILVEAVQSPEKFGILYKKDGSVDIMDVSGKVTIDPETGNTVSYFKQNSVGNLGNGIFVEGEPLEIVTQEGKKVTGTYFGTMPGGEVYQWSPGKKAISQEEWAQGLKNQSGGNIDLGREIDNLTNWVKDQFGRAKEFIAPTQPKPESSLPAPRLLAEAGMSDVSPVSSGIKLPALGTRILNIPQFQPGKAISEGIAQVVQPRVEKIKEIANVILPKAPVFKPAEQVAAPEGIRIEPSQVQLPSVTTPTQAPVVTQPSLRLATPPVTPLQTMAQQPSFTPPTISGGGPEQLIKQAQQPTLEQKLWGGIKNLATKITKSWPFNR